MANIMDYLAWRGDLSWAGSAFNEVDNLILSELVYVDFSGIVPEAGQGAVSLKEASRKFFEIHTDEEINAKVSSTKVAAFLMRGMAATARFRDIRLANYVNDISLNEQSQFCAVTVYPGDGSCCVVYSGTDATIVGWREDFNMAFLTETPGQLKAVCYLKGVAAESGLPLRIMGHSKGGNLAVYAATHVESDIMERIEIVYSNDGPGFSDSMMEQRAMECMLPKINTIIPESSIVGMLFEHEEEYEVVKSSGSGAGQHDIMSWEVCGPALVHLNHVDGKSVLLDRTLKSWLAQMDSAHRRAFVDTLFGILEEADIHTVDDLAALGPAKILELYKLASLLDKENQEVMKKTIRRLVEEGEKTLRDALKRRRSEE